MSETQTTPVRARRAQRAPAPEAPPPMPAAAEPALQQSEVDAPMPARPARKPFGGRRQKLDNSERPGFHRHWFNDVGNRIRDALEAGYTHVKDQHGKNMSHVVGVAEHGGGITAFRMEIPLEWYEEDQRNKLAANEEKMRQIKQGIVAGVAPGEDGSYRPVNKAGTIGADIRIGNRR